MKKHWDELLVNGILLILLGSGMILVNNHLKKTTQQKIDNFKCYTYTFPIKIKKDTSFSKEKFINYVYSLNPKYPEIIIAQAILETGNFSSFLFYNNNNLFGMTTIGNRPTTSIGSEHGFAYFKTWKDSVLDYLIYQCLYLNDKTYEEYLQYLDDVYAEDESYINKVQTIANEYKSLN